VTCTGGTTVTLAVAILLGSAALVAVTLTVCGVASAAGAEYKPPLEIVPTAGLTDHETPALAVPVTVAMNCWVCETVSEVMEGVSETVTGMRVTVALADMVGSAVLVAFTVTFAALAIEAGAVYNPLLEMVPCPLALAPLSDQLTPVLTAPAKVAVNCWDCEAVSETEAGATERLAVNETGTSVTGTPVT
jgi:hypothetical protein